jgi:hypothetical protein
MADITADGKMDRKEFSIAMTLIKRKLQGHQLPSVLPPSMLVDPMMSTGSSTLPANMGFPGFSMMAPAPSLPPRVPVIATPGFGAPLSAPAPAIK